MFFQNLIREWKKITREMGDIGKLMENQFLSLLSYVAEQERKNSKQRQREGKAVAKANGKRLGRPGCEVPPNFQDICREWREGKMTAVEAMHQAGMKETSFYKAEKKG